MKRSQIKIIECFTKLIVYTLEFQENSANELYTMEKLLGDYKRLIEEAKEDFTFDDFTFEEAFFPIAAWIDEVVLASNNPEKKLWRRELLQKRFFNTSNAGYEFFEKLENLEPNAYELRLLYLYCIFLGFKGKYYKAEDKRELEKIFDREKSFLQDGFLDAFPKYAFKKAYLQGELPAKKKFSTSYRKLWIIIALSLVVGVFLFLASQAYLNGLLDQYSIF